MITERHSVCPLDCPDTCSLTVSVENDRILAIKGSHANPYTAGVLCAKVPASYPGFVHGERRIRTPLRRHGARGAARFERISWDEALHMMPVINRAKKQGAKLVVVDPRRTTVARQADLHIALRPGTDVVLAWAVAAELERRGAIDREFVARHVEGYEEYMALARRYGL